mmetsp:Transcript_45684/g.130960  ORF Transcript_45684/g.130960 Transcript_45684/m.130960 type:complete len:317 (+) Transcript_45684:249-1199(+)
MHAGAPLAHVGLEDLPQEAARLGELAQQRRGATPLRRGASRGTSLGWDVHLRRRHLGIRCQLLRRDRQLSRLLGGEDHCPGAVRLLDVRVSHEVELVDDAACPQVVTVALVQDHKRLQVALAGLPGHEVIHRLVNRRGNGEEPPGSFRRDHIGHCRVDVLCLADGLARVHLLELVEVAAPPTCPAQVQHVEVGGRLAQGHLQPLPQQRATERAQARVGALEDELHVVLQHQRRVRAPRRDLPNAAVRMGAPALARRHLLDLPWVTEPLRELKPHFPGLARGDLREHTRSVILDELPLPVVLLWLLFGPPPVHPMEL